MEDQPSVPLAAGPLATVPVQFPLDGWGQAWLNNASMKEGMVCYETPDHQHEQRIRLYLLLLYDLQGNRVMAICAGEN